MCVEHLFGYGSIYRTIIIKNNLLAYLSIVHQFILLVQFNL